MGMARELGNRIERSVVSAVSGAGFEALLEEEKVNGLGEPDRNYRVVASGGMVPFADIWTHVENLLVSVDVTPVPDVGPVKDRYAYFVEDPGKTPSRSMVSYAATREWAATPEVLAAMVLAAVRKFAAEAGQTPDTPF